MNNINPDDFIKTFFNNNYFADEQTLRIAVEILTGE